jgi:hypothetical protein
MVVIADVRAIDERIRNHEPLLDRCSVDGEIDREGAATMSSEAPSKVARGRAGAIA